jgi:hypothetical protein
VLHDVRQDRHRPLVEAQAEGNGDEDEAALAARDFGDDSRPVGRRRQCLTEVGRQRVVLEDVRGNTFP